MTKFYSNEASVTANKNQQPATNPYIALNFLFRVEFNDTYIPRNE